MLCNCYHIKQENLNLKHLVEYYQNAILSEEYTNILNIGLEKLKHKSIKEDKQKFWEIYLKQIETNKRIKKHEYDKNFIYEELKNYI